MRQALALAERGRGHTHPNPVVGAILVRGNRVLARGYHHRAGLPHAEDFLDLGDAELVGIEQGEQPEPCGIGEGPQGING